MDFREIKEYGASSGLGTILAHKNMNDTKYHITCVTTTIPSIFGSQNTIEWSSTSNNAITQIPAKKSTNSVEIPFLWNADNIDIMDSIADKELQYAVINLDDGTGWKFNAKASYRMNDASADSAREGILQLTISSVKDRASFDLLDVYMDTISYDGSIPQKVEVSASSGADDHTQEIAFTTNPDDASISVESSSTSIATISYETGKVTITGVAVGTCYVTIKATKSNYAGANRKIYVIVK